MGYATLAVALLIAIGGWVKNHIALLALCHFIKAKGYPPPNEVETKASTEFVVRHIFKR